MFCSNIYLYICVANRVCNNYAFKIKFLEKLQDEIKTLKNIQII